MLELTNGSHMTLLSFSANFAVEDFLFGDESLCSVRSDAAGAFFILDPRSNARKERPDEFRDYGPVPIRH